jgi:hypothetical protein
MKDKLQFVEHHPSPKCGCGGSTPPIGFSGQ